MEGYIESRNKYSHLSSEERGKIEAYLHQGFSISRIAIYLKRSKSTISDELRRERYNERYTAEISHQCELETSKSIRWYPQKAVKAACSWPSIGARGIT